MSPGVCRILAAETGRYESKERWTTRPAAEDSKKSARVQL